MRNLRILLFCIMGFFASTGAEARYTKVFQSGAWEGLAFYKDDNGAFNFCAISAEYKSGLTMYIALYPAGAWQLIFYRNEGFNSGASTFSLYADERPLYTGEGSAEGNGKLLRIDIPLSEPVIRGLKFGNTLRVSSNYGNASFSLNGTSAAIASLYHCVVNRRGDAFGPGAETTRTAPQGEAEKNANSEPRIVSRERLIGYATEVLQNAGLNAYRFLPAEGGGSASKAVVWQFEDGSIGSIIAIEHADSLDLDKFTGEITGSDTESCTGDFANGKRAPRYLNGLEIRKIFTSCNAGSKSFYADYALVRLPNGLLVKLMSANIGSNAPAGRDVEGSTARDRAARTEEATFATFAKL